MRSLTLLRHAKSDWSDRGQRDFDRVLNPRGKRAAHTIGEYLQREQLAFDYVIASPAARVRETIACVEDGLGRPLDPQWERKVYMASAAILMELAQAAPDAAQRVLIVGHNPGLEDLALMLAAEGSPYRDVILDKYPTATLAELCFDGARWADLADGGSRIARFVRPRDLDPSLGPDDA